MLTTLLVPQGMAYAELAGLPRDHRPVHVDPVPDRLRDVRPSRILVLGPDSSLGPMIAATILPIIGANGSPERAIALASMLALIVGAIMIAAGDREARVRRRPALQTDAIGYMNGLALTILIGQLPKLFGFSIDADGLIDEAHAVRARARVTARPSAPLSRSASLSLALILALGRWLPRVPAVLVAVVAAIAATIGVQPGRPRRVASSERSPRASRR